MQTNLLLYNGLLQRCLRLYHTVITRIRVAFRAMFRSPPRDNELALTIVAALLGAVVAVVVGVVSSLVSTINRLLFTVPSGHHLSEGNFFLDTWRILIVTTAGGAVVAIVGLLIRWWRPRDVVDAIEANALYGGRVSLIDSVNLTLLTILSVGFGASVGLEATLTQFGSGIASRLGRMLRLRRVDLRTLVGCGAAAALSAMFNAPLAGAFYAFELIIGTYSLSILPPVTVAALAGSLVSHEIRGSNPVFVVFHSAVLTQWDYFAFTILGLGAAVVSIVTMLAVTWVDQVLRKLLIPNWSRPIVGGFAVGIIAIFFPQVLGSGHGAILHGLQEHPDALLLIAIITAKIAGSAISIGSGFRGGLFTSSLMIGSLYGGIVAAIFDYLAQILRFSDQPIDIVTYMLVGMGAIAAGIIGSPITMILLVLETSGDLPLAIGVMVAVIVCSLTVRICFGYSFATWRFHLRGLRIKSGNDVGWIEDLTVSRLMNRSGSLVPHDTTIGLLRQQFPISATKRVFVVDENGRYLGDIDMIDAHSHEYEDNLPVTTLLSGNTVFLLPASNIRTALMRFETASVEVLAVVDSVDTRRPVGFLSEAYALRRYNHELECHRAEIIGEDDFFSNSSKIN